MTATARCVNLLQEIDLLIRNNPAGGEPLHSESVQAGEPLHSESVQAVLDKIVIKESVLPRQPKELFYGNREYKRHLKLNNPAHIVPSMERLQLEKRSTQMLFRLQEGQGKAVYLVGVEDNGRTDIGLTKDEMLESIRNMVLITDRVGINIKKIIIYCWQNISSQIEQSEHQSPKNLDLGLSAQCKRYRSHPNLIPPQVGENLIEHQYLCTGLLAQCKRYQQNQRYIIICRLSKPVDYDNIHFELD